MALIQSEPTVEQLQQLESIKVNHDEAYLYISQGLSYQEQHQYSLARDMYQKGLEKIDKALNIRCDRQYCHGNGWENARKLQQKMRMSSQTIKSQLNEIQNLPDTPTTSSRTMYLFPNGARYSSENDGSYVVVNYPEADANHPATNGVNYAAANGGNYPLADANHPAVSIGNNPIPNERSYPAASASHPAISMGSNLVTNGRSYPAAGTDHSTSKDSIYPKFSNYPTTNGTSNVPYCPPAPFEQPPSYDEACEHEIVSAQRRLSCPTIPDDKQNGRRSTEVVELFSVKDEVLLFYVSQDGSVSTTSTQSSLHIYQFVDRSAILDAAPAWLQIGSWTYPLIPGQSPALESGYGAFIFPNVSEGQGSAVGVILPPTVDAERRAQFLNILNSLTAFKEEKELISSTEASGAESFSDTLSRGIVTGAEYLSYGLIKGAALSSNLIHKGAVKAKQKINPEDKPVIVDPRVKEGLRIAREASDVAYKATGYLVKKLGDLTVALGKQIAPHIKTQGSRLLSTALKKDEKQASDTMDGVLTVAAGGLQGFSTVYMGLEEAARTLAYSLSSETVNIVGHKYGSDVGEVVGNAVFSIGNLALTTHNVQSLGIKGVAKRTAKDTGKAILEDYVDKEKKPGKH